MSNAQFFLNTFNKIHKHLEKLINPNKPETYSNFMSLVSELRNRNSSIRNYYSDLIAFAELRNAIVHNDKPIADPYQDTLITIENIYKQLTTPPKAINIATKNVQCFKTEDLISKVVKIMGKENFTQVPIYKDNDLVGIFSESTLLKWLNDKSEKDGFILEEIKIGEIIKYLDEPSNNNFNEYLFVNREVNVFDVLEYFTKSSTTLKRLSAIFITQSGSKNEAPIGIITAWDLPKIKKLLLN